MRFMKLMFNLEDAEFTPLVLELALVTVKFQRNLETWKLAWKPYRQHVSGSEVTCAQLVFRVSFVCPRQAPSSSFRHVQRLASNRFHSAGASAR